METTVAKRVSYIMWVFAVPVGKSYSSPFKAHPNKFIINTYTFPLQSKDREQYVYSIIRQAPSCIAPTHLRSILIKTKIPNYQAYLYGFC